MNILSPRQLKIREHVIVHCINLLEDERYRLSASLIFKVKTTVHFHDDANAKIANMEIQLRLSSSGRTIVNEFNLDNNVDKQTFAMTKGCECPDTKPVDANRQHDDDDDDDWDIIGAELNNGQKIAIKYKKDYYQFESSSEFDGPCENPEVKPTESEERLNKYILKLMGQMHRMVAENVSQRVRA